jgi:tRNA (guanine-N7-)-methyltransferase
VTARAHPGIEIEIGCGNGHFLAEYAARVPDVCLVGIDIKQKRCTKAREKAAKRGLSNVTIVHASAELYLQEVPRGSVGAFHIYFPDPWPKSRHRKRRFFTMENLRMLHGLLADGGRLFFGTDFFDYYIQAKVLAALHRGFELDEEPAPAEVLQSIYAQKSITREKRIHIFTAVKVASAGDEAASADTDAASADGTAASADDEGEQDEQQRSVDGDVQADQQG